MTLHGNVQGLRHATCRGRLHVAVGVSLPPDSVADEEAVAAVVRITGCEFRLPHWFLSQIERIPESTAYRLSAMDFPRITGRRLVG